jgi:hypothetical protein
MSKRIIQLNDNYSNTLREEVRVVCSQPRPKGEVTICEKKNGKLIPIFHKDNLIVFSGRHWLLRRAFGVSMDGNVSSIYDKTIRWFGVGNGGGEPGNPLQAGATYGQDENLYQPVRIRSDLDPADPGYTMYASDYNGNHGYYKRFSSVVIREDHANPYTVGNVTKYPPIIAEIRIELSSDDADGGSYEDLNEAALFVSDVYSPVDDPGLHYATTGTELGTGDVIKVATDGDYAIYYIDTYDLATLIPNIRVGDSMWVDAPIIDVNRIVQSAPALVVDLYNGEAAVRKGYIIVEKPGAMDTDYTPTYPVAHINDMTITPYIMFSRVTFSTIRKTVDREIVFLWKIYF